MTQQTASAVERYISNYLELTSQDAEEASCDNQLSSLVLSIAERIKANDRGVIVDVGCGDGILLNRLIEIPQFMAAAGWLYVAVDTEKHLANVTKITRASRLSRRVEEIELSSFYKEWPNLGAPQIVFCRNVLHELNIDETATLLSHISKNLSLSDTLIVQDLFRLPAAERKSACWISNMLSECLQDHGFSEIACVEQVSKNGNGWFNLVMGRAADVPIEKDISKRLIKAARQQQWTLWGQVDRASTNGNRHARELLIESLDLDLQLASLTRQLLDAGAVGLVLDGEIEKRLKAQEINARISDFVTAGKRARVTIKENLHFRERGAQLTTLENFLRSTENICVVHGGQGTGKTTIVRHLLETRAYEKSVVIIDGRRCSSFWSFLEDFLTQLGIRLSPELLSVLKTLTPASVEMSLRQLINAFANKTILFFDNFSEIHGSNGTIFDPDLGSFLDKWGGKQGAKFIAAARSPYLPPNFLKAGAPSPTTVLVGRYASDQTVTNILDDHFDRAAAGISEYPEALLRAIDRHPLIVSLAAQNLKKHGRDLLLDEAFVNELRHKLRGELWARLVDDHNSEAIEIASQLRVAVPLEMLKLFAQSEAIEVARADELLHVTFDNRWNELLGVLGVFRLRDVSDKLELVDLEAQPAIDHKAIAAAYRSIYRQDDDPKWIRESYYHLLLAGGGDGEALSLSLGQYYFTELVASADYTYMRKKDHGLALTLYETARKIAPLREQSEMRRASCLIRKGFRDDGDKAYAKLISQYPDKRGIKTSYIDALLALSEFKAAHALLQQYDLPKDDLWVAYEWGRVLLGLDRYKEAVEAFRPLVAEHSEDYHFHIFYSRALWSYGALFEAQSVLEKACRQFLDEIAVASAFGSVLEQNGHFEHALNVLEPIFKGRDDNAVGAASLVRIYCRDGRINEAISTRRHVEKGAPAKFKDYILACTIEIKLHDKQFDAALHEAEQLDLGSAYGNFIYLRAYLDAVEKAPDALRSKLLSTVMSYRLPTSLEHNAPVQLIRAELAALAKRRDIFDVVLEKLALTALPLEKLAHIREMLR